MVVECILGMVILIEHRTICIRFMSIFLTLVGLSWPALANEQSGGSDSGGFGSDKIAQATESIRWAQARLVQMLLMTDPASAQPQADRTMSAVKFLCLDKLSRPESKIAYSRAILLCTIINHRQAANFIKNIDFEFNDNTTRYETNKMSELSFLEADLTQRRLFAHPNLLVKLTQEKMSFAKVQYTLMKVILKETTHLFEIGNGGESPLAESNLLSDALLQAMLRLTYK